MATIEEQKELGTPETPLILFDCVLPSGETHRWSTHGVEFNGYHYPARILRHDLFEMRSSSEDGTDGISRLTLTIANADSFYTPVERNGGWKGAKLSARLVFFNLQIGNVVSDSQVLFRGTANPPDESTESYLKLSFTNRLSLQRIFLPDVRVQKRCPWSFPSTDMQRAEALGQGVRGSFSPYYRCGYSAGAPGGLGNLNEGKPFTSCDFSRSQCTERGMFKQDEYGNRTARFGGIEFVPPSTLVRGYGDRSAHLSSVIDNQARYNDYVPLIYGTGWVNPLIVFARNDGNLTRMEVLLGLGEVSNVLKVIVNDVEIPEAVSGANMTATGWYSLVTEGSPRGNFNVDFIDSSGNPVGDPYGSMAYLSVVVPNRISDGRSLPTVTVLAQGLKLARFDILGNPLGSTFSNNPAWVLLDVLRRTGWDPSEIDIPSFARMASRCDELVPSSDTNGVSTLVPRYQCNLRVLRRTSAADVVRGVRLAALMYLVFNRDGQLELRAEDTLAVQQPKPQLGSNSNSQILGGWPTYEFGDNEFSGIVRRENGQPAFRVWSRSCADSPNRFSLEFQDEFNEYQQDGLSLVDLDDSFLVSQEVAAIVPAFGVPNFDQATRIIALQLNKSIRGNTYVDFDSSVRAVDLRPGDLITITYSREGWQRQVFRVIRVAPAKNYRTVSITAQIHRDEWYQVSPSRTAVDGRLPSYDVGIPRPIAGAIFDDSGQPQLQVVERLIESSDGSSNIQVDVAFAPPNAQFSSSLGIPLVSFGAEVIPTGGHLAGGQTVYYSVSAVDALGREGALSFIVKVALPGGSLNNRIVLPNLQFPSKASSFNVYRGTTPVELFQIATGVPIATEFTDDGGTAILTGPPDPNFDHVNVYWRLELFPEEPVTLHTATSVGNTSIHMAPNEFSGRIVRITRGTGSGQEREILGNTSTDLTVTRAWAVEPDASSYFVICESSWRFGASSSTSPISFDVPNREGVTLHLCGRSANVRNIECAYEVSLVTRYQIEGTGGSADAGVPPSPLFGLTLSRAGRLEVGGISFPSPLTNVKTITAGTFSLWFWDEILGRTTIVTTNMDETVGTIALEDSSFVGAGAILQIDGELCEVLPFATNDTAIPITRGSSGSTPTVHTATSTIYILEKKVFIIPFPKGFFGSPASGSFAFPVYLPDVRIACAELFMTNSWGDGFATKVAYTSTRDQGLRTWAGGQLSLQVEGKLAIQSNAVPPLVIDSARSVRDVFATLGVPATGGAVVLEITQSGRSYCILTIPPGSTSSNIVDGFGLPALREGAIVGLNITAVSQDGSTAPGRDLSVTIRL